MIFLSYATASRAEVKRIRDELARSGFEVWWDRSLHAGDDFGDIIDSQLRRADRVLVCWSRPARHSLWVRAEAAVANSLDKLVQIRIDDVTLPLPFNILRFVDLTGWRGDRSCESWKDLERSLRGRPIVNHAVRGDRHSDAASGHWRYFGPTVAAGAGALALVGAVAMLTIFVATDRIHSSAYGLVSMAILSLACLSLGQTSTRVIQAALATGRG